MGSRIHRRVEGESTIGIPVAIDVLGPRNASTCIGIVANEVRNGIAGGAEVGIHHDGALALGDVVIVIDVEGVGELRFQTGISLRDVERVGVVGDVEQLGDVGLTGVAAIVKPNVALLMELVVEVDGRRQVHDVSDGIDIHAAVVLNEV